jgi:hypothetical protein
MKTPKLTKNQKKTVENGRDRAATVLDKASDVVRSGSQRAAGLIDKGGKRAAGALHTSAERVQPKRTVTRRGLRRSPLFIAFALITLAVVLLIVRSQLSSDEDDDDFDF